MRAPYADVLRVRQEADDLPDLADAWSWDHLMPIADPEDDVPEVRTLLSALAASTRRLRPGLLVTSNRFRHPARARPAGTRRRHPTSRPEPAAPPGRTPPPPNTPDTA
ncbi:hypothetical protein [Kitasatospora sp. NPDC096140]|uniref:hypothetical protein n=1 Tax=Kitasatospora sp. NPDC096140 TaxID=3155425 RepID=UPI00331B1600